MKAPIQLETTRLILRQPLMSDAVEIFVLRPQGALLAPVPSNAGMRVRFTSMPGSMHQLQRASTPVGTWMALTNLVVPGNGIAEFDDTSPPSDAAFYRLLTR